jgi:hypothetical protein
MIFLPRQARDRHGESTQEERMGFFAGDFARNLSANIHNLTTTFKGLEFRNKQTLSIASPSLLSDDAN